MSRRAPSPVESAFGSPLDYPYLIGVYLAVNAVSDLGLLVDGPDCALLKAEHICGRHDLRSTLLDCAGRGRVAYSATDVRSVALSREAALRRSLGRLARVPGLRALLVTGLPMCSLTGAPYERIARAAGLDLPAGAVPARSLEGGWMLGYAEALDALAGLVEPEPGGLRPDEAAVIGYLMDRNEEDHRANIEQLGRMVAALGLKPAGVWLEGGPFEGLRRAARAGTLLALPCGRRAARTLAARTGARVVELDLPLGLEGTRRSLEAAGRALGREKEAARFCAAELARVVPRLEWAAPQAFLHRRFMVALDPCLLGPVCELLEELGGTVASAVSVGRGPEDGGPEGLGRRALVRPTWGVFRREKERVLDEGLDLLIGGSDAVWRGPRARASMELGFPSRFWHALSPSPFLGFEGALHLLGRAANELAAGRVRASEDEA